MKKFKKLRNEQKEKKENGIRKNTDKKTRLGI